MSKSPLTLQIPAPPEPVSVVLDPTKTALLVFDIVDHIAERQPKCREHLAPAVAVFLARVRQIGLTIAYGTRAHNLKTWLPEVAPASGDIEFESKAQDRFYGTELDTMLKAKGITTLILTGWKISGSVTYTSVGATLRGYTVVVPVDATSDATDYEMFIGKYQILNQNSANATNEPLKPKASTLSRTDLITLR
jgi:nicotinamidase-related amidase